MNSLSAPEFLTVFFGVCSDAIATSSSMLYVITSVWNTLRSFRAWKKSLFANWRKKTNRKSKTNTRKSVRRLFWVFLTALVLLSSFGWSPRWDEEGLCSDKGKRNTDYTIGLTYLCYRKRAWGSRKDRMWWQKNHFSYLVPLENTDYPISFQSGMGMLFFQYTQKVIGRHLSAIGFLRKEKQ